MAYKDLDAKRAYDREYAQRYRETHREQCRAYNREYAKRYRAANPERCRAYNEAYRNECRDVMNRKTRLKRQRLKALKS